ncbi:unnamed protein product [Linum tenue]|uniref:F-box protein n=1 Tax=Linum tenue TaxID=586396 RepID=A0AAV0R4J0_9ROSI|nr:unnamed protein product [Linum tenue]
MVAAAAASDLTEEDRISELPDEIIHNILHRVKRSKEAKLETAGFKALPLRFPGGCCSSRKQKRRCFSTPRKSEDLQELLLAAASLSEDDDGSRSPLEIVVSTFPPAYGNRLSSAYCFPDGAFLNCRRTKSIHLRGVESLDLSHPNLKTISIGETKHGNVLQLKLISAPLLHTLRFRNTDECKLNAESEIFDSEPQKRSKPLPWLRIGNDEGSAFKLRTLRLSYSRMEKPLEIDAPNF